MCEQKYTVVSTEVTLRTKQEKYTHIFIQEDKQKIFEYFCFVEKGKGKRHLS